MVNDLDNDSDLACRGAGVDEDNWSERNASQSKAALRMTRTGRTSANLNEALECGEFLQRQGLARAVRHQRTIHVSAARAHEAFSAPVEDSKGLFRLPPQSRPAKPHPSNPNPSIVVHAPVHLQSSSSRSGSTLAVHRAVILRTGIARMVLRSIGEAGWVEQA
jgi:hypothetical protein